MKLLVVFRADASLNIGTGHVMRCLTVANMLRDRGASCHFICRDLPGNLNSLISGLGYRVHALPSPIAERAGLDARLYTEWLGVDWTLDARQSADAMAALSFGERIDWLIVDHYALDVHWEDFVREMCCRILVVDDLADRTHRCDALIDQSMDRTPAEYSAFVNDDCRLMTGAEYALLRPEFAALRQGSLARRANARLEHMLISLGGIDKTNATGVVLEGLVDCDLPAHLEVTVVMGAQAPWLDSVRAQAARLPWTTRTMVEVGDMASLMASADIAIGAAGTTTWERACLGLPSVVLKTAENQSYILSKLAAHGSAVIGDLTRLSAKPRELKSLLKRLIDRRQEYGMRAAALTDGAGCERLLHAILEEN